MTYCTHMREQEKGLEYREKNERNGPPSQPPAQLIFLSHFIFFFVFKFEPSFIPTYILERKVLFSFLVFSVFSPSQSYPLFFILFPLTQNLMFCGSPFMDRLMMGPTTQKLFFYIYLNSKHTHTNVEERKRVTCKCVCVCVRVLTNKLVAPLFSFCVRGAVAPLLPQMNG